MIVELKKVKITASIIKQLLYANTNQISKYEVLGWCISITKGAKRKIILLYDEPTHTICYIPFPTLIEIRQNASPTFYVAYVSDSGLVQYNDSTYHSKEDMQKLVDVMVKMKQSAIEKGQLFY